jgi:cytochrome c biogenesis protein CcdA
MTAELISALALAVSAGAIAAFNPCGFAMLPAYLALFLGEHSGRRAAVGRALAVASAVTVGFVLVFGVAGLLVTVLSIGLGDWLSLVTVASGVLLLGVGGYLLAGREFSVNIPRARLTVDGSPRGMIAYGVIYATVSLSCTLPVFLAAVVSAFTVAGGSAAVGVVALLGYAFGMGAVLAVLALVTALFGSGTAGRMRAVLPHVKRISGAFLLLAGAYVTWYGWVEYRAFQGDLITGGPVAWVSAASSRIGALIADAGAGLVVVAAVLLALAAVITALRRRRAPDSIRVRMEDEG